MRPKKYQHLLQVKITKAPRRKLHQASEQTGINIAELARLSLRLGLPKLLDKLPSAEAEQR